MLRVGYYLESGKELKGALILGAFAKALFSLESGKELKAASVIPGDIVIDTGIRKGIER